MNTQNINYRESMKVQLDGPIATPHFAPLGRRRGKVNGVRDDYKPGDRVKHKGTGEVGTIVSVREGDVARAYGGRRKLYTIDFGRSIIFAFDIEMNIAEYLAEALEPAA